MPPNESRDSPLFPAAPDEHGPFFLGPEADDAEDARAFVDRAAGHLFRLLAETAAERSMPPDDVVAAADAATLWQDEPGSVESLLDDVERAVRGSARFGAPGHIGHMDPAPTLASVIGDLAAAAINNNQLSRELSPFLSRLELRLVAAIARDLFGLGPESGGTMQSGGSLGNLHALAVARNARLPEVARRGLHGSPRRPVILATETAHTSIVKAGMVLGLGSDGVVPIRADAAGRMDPGALEDAIAHARTRGEEPFAVVAIAGSTVTGSIDPLPAVADIAARHDLWFHVDAVYGGALCISDRFGGLLDGIERADSVTFNPQKWWSVARTCGLTMFRDFARMPEDFRVDLPYMRDEFGLNLGQITLQGSRAAEVLKLWLTMRHLGRRGLAELVDWSMACGKSLAAEIRRRPDLRLAVEPEMNIVVFRPVLPERSAEARDALVLEMQRRLLEEADIFLSTPRFRDGYWLRAVPLNPTFGPDRHAAMFRTIDAALAVPCPG